MNPPLRRALVRTMIAPLALSGPLSLTACDRADPLAPPVIYFGEDACHECDMIISDERYAAAAIRTGEAGRPEPLLFDDIGCLLAVESDGPEPPLLARYVRDFATQEWLEVDRAFYLHSPRLESPMAFGVGAAPSREAAEALRGEYPGDVLDPAGIRQRYLDDELFIEPGRQGQGTG